jgi:mono/diheme cytochrome c family protein
MRWAPLVAIGAVAFAVVAFFALLSRIDLNAVREPSRIEEYLRVKITRAVIKRRSAREVLPAPPADRETSMSIAAGKNLYITDCAGCHGAGEPSPTVVGRGMFPRAVDLDAANVQSYSDRELFSIIRNGVRFTGMPGFAAVETGDQTWSLVDYVRSLR